VEFFYKFMDARGPGLVIATVNVNRRAACRVSLNYVHSGNGPGRNAVGIDRYSGSDADGTPFTDRNPPARQEAAVYSHHMTSLTWWVRADNPQSETRALAVFDLFEG
jgi:hypothetical protein